MADQTVTLNYAPKNGKLLFIPDVDPIQATPGQTIEFVLGNAPDGAQFVLRFEQPLLFRSEHNRVQNSGLLQSGDGELEISAKAAATREKYHCKLFKDGKEQPTDEQPGGDIIISGSMDN